MNSDWPIFRDRLVAQHHASPQQAARARHALALVREGLDALAGLGHLFHLAEGSAPPVSLWPHLVYDVNGHIREVHHPSDLRDLGPGWFTSLDEARHDAGLNAQFAGRGGVQRGGLPAVIKEKQNVA